MFLNSFSRMRKTIIGAIAPLLGCFPLSKGEAGDFARCPWSGGAIVFNEIMYAPSPGEPEWLELRNNGSGAVSLRGWAISDANLLQRHPIAPDDLILAPGEYLVLTRDSATLALVRPAIPCRVRSVPGFPSLNNDGDALYLYSGASIVMDSVSYRPEWGGGSGGRSLEKIDPGAAGEEPSSWGTCVDPAGATAGEENSIAMKELDLCVRTGGGTPLADRSCRLWVVIRNVGRIMASGASLNLSELRAGAEPVSLASLVSGESIAPGDSTIVCWLWSHPSPGMHRIRAVITLSGDERSANDSLWFSIAVPASRGALVVNEIMFAPLPGEAEYIELWNASDMPVNLSGWKLHDRGGSVSNTVIVPTQAESLLPGAAVVIASDSTLFRFFPSLEGPTGGSVLIPGQWSLRLNNDGDDVVLKDPSGGTIDSVAYSPSWHNPAVIDRTGRSLERISTSGGSNDPANWTTCAFSAGGTPARKNSVSVVGEPQGGALSCYPNPFSPDGDGIGDATVIRYHLPQGSWSVTLSVFDARGRLIRRLGSGEATTGPGEAVWDGRDDGRTKARMGIYILLLQAIDESLGISVTIKGVVVLAGRL